MCTWQILTFRPAEGWQWQSSHYTHTHTHIQVERVQCVIPQADTDNMKRHHSSAATLDSLWCCSAARLLRIKHLHGNYLSLPPDQWFNPLESECQEVIKSHLEKQEFLDVFFSTLQHVCVTAASVQRFLLVRALCSSEHLQHELVSILLHAFHSLDAASLLMSSNTSPHPAQFRIRSYFNLMGSIRFNRLIRTTVSMVAHQSAGCDLQSLYQLPVTALWLYFLVKVILFSPQMPWLLMGFIPYWSSS